MTRVIDQLAEITGFRDRDSMDATLVVALRDMLQPELVAIYRCVGDGPGRRWLTRARLAKGDRSPSADGLWTPLDSLPAWADFPARARAIALQRPVLLAGPPVQQVFALSGGQDVASVLEVTSPRALEPAARRTVVSILRVYSNFRVLLDDSEHDTLTGLLNRKTFDAGFYRLAGPGLAADGSGTAKGLGMAAGAVADQEADRRLLQAPGQHYICMVDIDHFKQVNDTFGHLIGDEVLLLLSRLMRACFRYDDRLYRFGGEEFVVLMRCAGDTDALRALERLRAQVESHAFPQVGRITISVGFTALRPGDSPGSAFERADKAVYWAKSHGRNQVCNHAQLVARGELDDGTDVAGDVELF